MRIMRIVRILLLLFMCQALMLSCKKDDVILNENQHNLIGNWVNPEYTDSLMILEKSETLKLNEYGISFKTEGKLIERNFAGWCGTPPAAYSDYEGTWTRNDSSIAIEVGYWGGRVAYKWIIISIGDHKLTVEKRITEISTIH